MLLFCDYCVIIIIIILFITKQLKISRFVFVHVFVHRQSYLVKCVVQQVVFSSTAALGSIRRALQESKDKIQITKVKFLLWVGCKIWLKSCFTNFKRCLGQVPSDKKSSHSNNIIVADFVCRNKICSYLVAFQDVATFMGVRIQICMCSSTFSSISNLNAAWRRPCSTQAMSKGKEVFVFKPSNQFYRIQSLLQSPLHFQTSEGASYPVCIPPINSSGNEKGTYACTKRHASTDNPGELLQKVG